MIDIIWLVLILVSLVMYMITLIFLFEIKRRTKEKLGKAISWLIFSVFACGIIRVIELLEEFYIFRLQYLKEIVIVVASIFLLSFGIFALDVIRKVSNSVKK